MFYCKVVCLLCFLGLVFGGELADFGCGWKLRLDQNDVEGGDNVFEKNSLRLDCNGFGVSVNKVPRKDLMQLRLYENMEGRSKKMSEMLFPIAIGFKMAGLISIIGLGMTIFVVKTFLIAKTALVFSIGMLIAKFLYPDVHPKPHQATVDYEHSASDFNQQVYAQNGQESAGSYDTTSYSAYNNYADSYSTIGHEGAALAESSLKQYSVPAPSNASSVNLQPGKQSASKRYDVYHRQYQRPVRGMPTLFTMKKVTTSVER